MICPPEDYEEAVTTRLADFGGQSLHTVTDTENGKIGSISDNPIVLDGAEERRISDEPRDQPSSADKGRDLTTESRVSFKYIAEPKLTHVLKGQKSVSPECTGYGRRKLVTQAEEKKEQKKICICIRQ